MRPEASDVSVIIPTFNRAAMLFECLKSMVDQTRPPLEIVVVDDGSTDTTADVAAAFRPVVRYFHQENRGKPAALNSVVAEARGDWIWFFDDDDVALPDAIESRLDALVGNPGAALVISRFLWGTSDSSGRIVPGAPLQWPEFDAGDFYPKYLRSCFVSLCGMLVKRSLVSSVGPFDAGLLTSEDYDFALRLARGQRVAVCDRATFICRRHSGLRGPPGGRYEASQRERKFADGDREIGHRIRRTHHLAEYIGGVGERHLEPNEVARALLARLQVMAGKGLLAETAEDAAALAQVLDSTGLSLDERTAENLKGALQERYLTFRMCEAPVETFRRFAPLRSSPAGRSMLKVIARSILGLAWWQRVSTLERIQLARLAVRLRWAAA